MWHAASPILRATNVRHHRNKVSPPCYLVPVTSVPLFWCLLYYSSFQKWTQPLLHSSWCQLTQPTGIVRGCSVVNVLNPVRSGRCSPAVFWIYDMIWYDTVYDMIYMIWCDTIYDIYYMVWYDIWYDIYDMIRYMIYIWYDTLYDISVNCNWVDTRWQQYSTHLHTNSTQNDTINNFGWKAFWDSKPEWSN